MTGDDSASWFAQEGVRCRLEWGRRGAKTAAKRGDILVVVDTLSFSTAVVTAVAGGAIVYPCATEAEAEATAGRVNGELAVRRGASHTTGRFSLSPGTLAQAAPGTRIVLPSPNGATCIRYGRTAAAVIVAAPVNAAAAGREIGRLLKENPEARVTVLACGERWAEPSEDGSLRFALEDFLGAGAILSQIPAAFSRSPEAAAAETAFQAMRNNFANILLSCGSGIELTARGYADDVHRAACIDAFAAVPVLVDGEFLAARNS